MIYQQTALQTVSNIENIQPSTYSSNVNIQQSISSINGSHLNKRRLSEDSYYPIAKKRTQNKIYDLMSHCATTSELKVLDDTPVHPKNAGLKKCIEIDKINERKKIIPQKKCYSTIKKKRPFPVQVLEPSASNRIAIQLLHKAIEDPPMSQNE